MWGFISWKRTTERETWGHVLTTGGAKISTSLKILCRHFSPDSKFQSYFYSLTQSRGNQRATLRWWINETNLLRDEVRSKSFQETGVWAFRCKENKRLSRFRQISNRVTSTVTSRRHSAAFCKMVHHSLSMHNTEQHHQTDKGRLKDSELCHSFSQDCLTAVLK